MYEDRRHRSDDDPVKPDNDAFGILHAFDECDVRAVGSDPCRHLCQ